MQSLLNDIADIEGAAVLNIRNGPIWMETEFNLAEMQNDPTQLRQTQLDPTQVLPSEADTPGLSIAQLAKIQDAVGRVGHVPFGAQPPRWLSSFRC